MTPDAEAPTSSAADVDLHFRNLVRDRYTVTLTDGEQVPLPELATQIAYAVVTAKKQVSARRALWHWLRGEGYNLIQRPDPDLPVLESREIEWQQEFLSHVEFLAGVHHFDKAASEPWAELIKFDSVTQRNTWFRFGLGTGTYIAVLGTASVIFFQNLDAGSLLRAAALLSLGLASFVAGDMLDTQQRVLNYTEALLKGAAKANAVRRFAGKIPTKRDPQARQQIIALERKIFRIIMGGLITFIFLGWLGTRVESQTVYQCQWKATENNSQTTSLCKQVKK